MSTISREWPAAGGVVGKAIAGTVEGGVGAGGKRFTHPHKPATRTANTDILGLTPMRTWSLVLLLVANASCTVRVPRLGGVVKVNTQVSVQVQVRAVPLPPPPPPPPPAPVVELQNAPVVEFFGIPLEGAADVVFVLDCSGSMADFARGRAAAIAMAPPEPSGPPALDPTTPMDPPPAPEQGAALPPAPRSQGYRKIDIAQQELVEALRRLPTGTAMNVLFFNDEIDGYAPSLVPLQDAGRDGLITFVSESVPEGKTALVPAMRAAFLMNARRIVLLSDGLGNVGGGSMVLLQDMREAIRGGVRIDAIGLGDDHDADLLRALATESGGLYQPL